MRGVPEHHVPDGEWIFIDTSGGHSDSQHILCGWYITGGSDTIQIIQVTRGRMRTYVHARLVIWWALFGSCSSVRIVMYILAAENGECRNVWLIR